MGSAATTLRILVRVTLRQVGSALQTHDHGESAIDRAQFVEAQEAIRFAQSSWIDRAQLFDYHARCTLLDHNFGTKGCG